MKGRGRTREDVLKLTDADARAIDHVMKSLLESGEPRRALDLVRKWEAFVDEVERGYELTIYDYENDLDTRDTLERLAVAVPGDLAGRLREALAPADERFRQATRDFPQGLRAAPAGWWYFRQPRKLTGELALDWQG